MLQAKVCGRWFQKAADQGNAQAENSLGVMYENGQGVSQDYVAALSWFQKAADQGARTAQFNLGLMYIIGRGVLQDYAAAMSWFRKAGRRPSSIQSGGHLRQRSGCPADVVSAHMWWNLIGGRSVSGCVI
jgi:uncharacterized protein